MLRQGVPQQCYVWPGTMDYRAPKCLFDKPTFLPRRIECGCLLVGDLFLSGLFQIAGLDNCRHSRNRLLCLHVGCQTQTLTLQETLGVRRCGKNCLMDLQRNVDSHPQKVPLLN